MPKKAHFHRTSSSTLGEKSSNFWSRITHSKDRKIHPSQFPQKTVKKRFLMDKNFNGDETPKIPILDRTNCQNLPDLVHLGSVTGRANQKASDSGVNRSNRTSSPRKQQTTKLPLFQNSIINGKKLVVSDQNFF